MATSGPHVSSHHTQIVGTKCLAQWKKKYFTQINPSLIKSVSLVTTSLQTQTKLSSTRGHELSEKQITDLLGQHDIAIVI